MERTPQDSAALLRRAQTATGGVLVVADSAPIGHSCDLAGPPPGPRLATGGSPAASSNAERSSRQAVRDSLAVAGWTAVSRGTGAVRAAVVAAVLGATYLGNTFQATNTLPNLVFEFLTGSLFATLLVPPLVAAIESGEDRRTVSRLASGYLGVVVVATAAACAAIVAAGPLVLRLLSSGVADPAAAAAQRRVGLLLLVLVMPQVVLYAVAATGGAVMNAHGRFGVAAAAPALENIGVLATMTAVVVAFGTGIDLLTVSNGQILLLGAGTTAAVALHAGLQLWGAARAGIVLVPRPFAGWREPRVRAVVAKTIPSLGYAGLNALRVFSVLLLANRVAGGVVAFQLALALFYLPVAVGARPVAVAALPLLSRLHVAGEMTRFRREYAGAAARALFVCAPAAAFCLGFAGPISDLLAFGAMGGEGARLAAASLAALAVGIAGEAAFVVATHACYALGDAKLPLRGMVLRTAGLAPFLVAGAMVEPGPGQLVLLGAGLSTGNVLSAWWLNAQLLKRLPQTGSGLSRSLARSGLAAAAMLVPAAAVLAVTARTGEIVSLLCAAVAALMTYGWLQLRAQSPEIAAFAGGLRGRWSS